MRRRTVPRLPHCSNAQYVEHFRSAHSAKRVTCLVSLVPSMQSRMSPVLSWLLGTSKPTLASPTVSRPPCLFEGTPGIPHAIEIKPEQSVRYVPYLFSCNFSWLYGTGGSSQLLARSMTWPRVVRCPITSGEAVLCEAKGRGLDDTCFDFSCVTRKYSRAGLQETYMAPSGSCGGAIRSL